jgi:hypothetical protein
MLGNDLVAIKKSGTPNKKTEVHIMSWADRYKTFVFQGETALHETGDTFAFTMLGNDLVAIKKSGTPNKKTEVHIMSWASHYSQFSYQGETVLHETGDDWSFVMLGNDLAGIKRWNTPNKKTEVHLMGWQNRYKSFIYQGETVLHEAH